MKAAAVIAGIVAGYLVGALAFLAYELWNAAEEAS